MALLSHSQQDNILTMMARLKQRAAEAQEIAMAPATVSKGVFNKPKGSGPAATGDDMVLNVVNRLRQKADAAMAEQKPIEMGRYDVNALSIPTSQDRPEGRSSSVAESFVTKVSDKVFGTGDTKEPVVDADAIDSAVTEAVTSSDSGLMSPPKARPFITPEKYKIAVDEMSDREMLARTIEAEAAKEKYTGKLAVAATIANRAASGNFGGDIRGVILKVGHFSPWNTYTGHDKGKQGKDMTKMKASEDSYKAADAILSGDYTDPTGGATHYVNEKVSQPDWLTEGGVGDVGMKGRARGTKQIGNHLFGNADNNEIYDGQAWAKMMADMATSPRPQKRPDTQVAGN